MSTSFEAFLRSDHCFQLGSCCLGHSVCMCARSMGLYRSLGHLTCPHAPLCPQTLDLVLEKIKGRRSWMQGRVPRKIQYHICVGRRTSAEARGILLGLMVSAWPRPCAGYADEHFSDPCCASALYSSFWITLAFTHFRWCTSNSSRRSVAAVRFSGHLVVTHLMHNRWCNVSVISTDHIMCPCHLQAQCGREFSSDWSSDNVLEMASALYQPVH